MTFCELPPTISFWFLLLGLVDVVGVCALLVIFTPERRHKKVYLHGIFTAAITIINQEYMFWAFKYPETHSIYLLECPLWLNLFELLCSTILVVLGVKVSVNFGKNEFTNYAIIKAINNMPISLCVSDSNGKMLLTNRSLYRTALKLFGEYPDNMEWFWKELKNGRINPEHHKLPSLKNDKPGNISIAMDDGRVLRFGRDVIRMMDADYIETTIVDVTKLYKMYDEIEMGNWTLIDKRMELKLLTDELINSNHEEEILNNKIKIHNEMGELILATQVLLKNGDELDVYRQKAKDWEIITQKLFNVNKTKTIEAGKQLEEILEVAEQIGCKVDIFDEVDEEIFVDSLVRQALREAIINAVRHGDASRVWVEDVSDEKNYGIIIKNDGAKPNELKMAGGLLNLKNGIAGKGGSLDVELTDSFSIVVKLPKL